MKEILQKNIDFKKSNPYKMFNPSGFTKDVDIEKSTVTGMANTCFFIDHDLDMTIPGYCDESIKLFGPNGSQTGNNIMHLKDHSWKDAIARIDVLEERVIDYNGNKYQGLYHESYYPPESEDSKNMLVKVQSGVYKDRSIGYRYRDLQLAEKDSDSVKRKELWDQYYPLALNPEKADEYGFFWVVKKIDLFEISDVTRGANQMSMYLGSKSNQKTDIISELFSKIDTMSDLMSNSNMTDKGIKELEMEKLQLKSYIRDILIHEEVDLKQTIIKDEGFKSNSDDKKKKDFLLKTLSLK